MDTTLSPDEGSGDNPDQQDETLSNAEFPIPLDTLDVSGTQPQVGDTVEAKVGGKVTRIVNDMAYVKPETVNGQPLPSSPISPNPANDERSRLMDLSSQAGDVGSGGY